MNGVYYTVGCNNFNKCLDNNDIFQYIISTISKTIHRFEKSLYTNILIRNRCIQTVQKCTKDKKKQGKGRTFIDVIEICFQSSVPVYLFVSN